MNLKIETLKELYLINKLSHATLIETNNQSFCVDEIVELAKIMSCEEYSNPDHKDCALCKMIVKRESLNLFIIEPDGKNIKKEQMIELKNKCSKMPILSKNNIYIIKNAEKFNASSANTILKFIEEPYDNCFGFFVTNSKDNIINTIRSRCEIYSINYENSSILETNNISNEEFIEIKNNLLEFLMFIQNEFDIIVNKEILLEKYKKKEEAIKFFNVLLDIYDNYTDLYLNKDVESKYPEFEFIKYANLNNLMKKKAIIINILNNMSYNLNMDLVFDKFVIEMGELNE